MAYTEPPRRVSLMQGFFRWFGSLPYKKYIAGFLMFLILITQTIRIDFFYQASAQSDKYEQLVSIVVDAHTYKKNRLKIQRYAQDIQGYLNGARAVIFVADQHITPAQIAAQNEKLYYEGDGSSGKQSILVGTILIGNIPLPMVQSDTGIFPSVYPYVDFDQKVFVYNESLGQYEKMSSSRVTHEAVEIWHGVINPAVGRAWDPETDPSLIAQFLDKTHDFYTKSGKFSADLIQNTPPRVFYYDGFIESKSADIRSVFQYVLRMKNIENLAYNRYSKYLLGDINRAILEYDRVRDEEYHQSLSELGIDTGGKNGLSQDLIDAAPDIQTVTVIQGLLKKFHEIVNKKTLGEELLYVRNAGRYSSGATVLADVGPVALTLTDEVAANILKTANDALEKSIDTDLKEKGYARRVPIYEKVRSGVGYGQRLEYTNYFFGTKGKDVTDASLCTIARGSTGAIHPFGRDILVEANTAFDVESVDPHVEKLKTDTEIFARHGMQCFSDDRAKIESYWGGNSMLRVVREGTGTTVMDPFEGFPEPQKFRGFSESIRSLAGMKESDRLPVASVSQCIDPRFQYTLKDPHLYLEEDMSMAGETQMLRESVYPHEWNRLNPNQRQLRFTCFSQVEEIPALRKASGPVVEYEGSLSGLILQGYQFEESNIPIVPEGFFEEVLRYRDLEEGCLVGEIVLDGQVIEKSDRSCTMLVGSAEDSTMGDKTTYRDIVYHTIDGISHHTSPTIEELAAAKKNGATPSLAIDTVRYIEFVTPKGNIARLEYPNFFRASGNTVAELRDWLRKEAERQWREILKAEAATSIPQEHLEIAVRYLRAHTLPQEVPNWNEYVSDEILTQVLQARRWIHPDVTEKYRELVESMLSYSRQKPIPDRAQDVPKTPPALSPEYEIAYLGLSDFVPKSDENNEEINTLQSQYHEGMATLRGINLLDERDAPREPRETQCGPPEGVNIFKWPAAIVCWIKAQLPPKVSAGKCGPNTIGGKKHRSTQVVDATYSDTIAEQLGKLSGAQVKPHFSRTYLSYHDTITFEGIVENASGQILPPHGTKAVLHIHKVVDTKDHTQVSPGDYDAYFSLEPQEVAVSHNAALFTLSSRDRSFTLEGEIEYILPLLGKRETKITSDRFTITANEAYLDIEIQQDGVPVATIEGAEKKPYTLSVRKKTTQSDVSLEAGKVRIIDDLTLEELFDGDITPGILVLPKTISSRAGVYRVIVNDAQFGGETTFSVQAGGVHSISIVPASRALVRGGTTVVGVSLQDIHGNGVMPDLYQIDVQVIGGKIIDASGNGQDHMRFDMLESSLSLVIEGTSAEELRIRASVPDMNIQAEESLRVFGEARIVLRWDNEQMQVGKQEQQGRVMIQDAAGNPLRGFESIATLSVPAGAGRVYPDVVKIKNGISESFTYIPGSLAGTHRIRVDVAGMNTESDIYISLQSGVPMYVDHSVSDETIVFFIRDRYGNIAPYTGEGNFRYNSEDAHSIQFDSGIAVLRRKPGYYILEVPHIANSQLQYSDEAGEYTLRGISKYATYVTTKRKTFDFYPDYNARYTVLAGGAFLREGEDILYHQTPGESQSLAVSTLLSSPYEEKTLFSIFPHGGYRIGVSDTLALNSRLFLEDGFPVLQVADMSQDREVARVVYRMHDDARLERCDALPCQSEVSGPHIRALLVSVDTAYTLHTLPDRMELHMHGRPIATISSRGKIQSEEGVQFVLENEYAGKGLGMAVEIAGEKIATVWYHMDDSRPVVTSSSNDPQDGVNVPVIRSTGFSMARIESGVLGGDVYGYSVNETSSTTLIDEEKNGPHTVESIGLLEESPGVGWKKNNRMLLSYAAGDTVGEATKWFHTYTFVNLGDPVAHVDHGRIGTQIDGIDRTIGTQIADSRRAQIQNFFHKDMNGDGWADITVQYDDGYLELFLNLRGNFRSRGMVAYLPYVGDNPLQMGDFSGDGYADIVSLDHSGSLVFLDNQERRFVEKKIQVDGSNTPTGIQQLKVYDMDADGRDDLVYLTQEGELGILYGSANGVFAKKILDETLGLALASETTDRGGAFYGSNVKQTVQLGMEDVTSTGMTDARIEAQAYYQDMRILPGADESVLPADRSGALLPLESLIAGYSGAVSQMEQYMEHEKNTSLGIIPSTPQSVESKIFVRSEYAEVEHMQVSKQYYTTGSGKLLPGDAIRAVIAIKNNTGSIRHAEYLDTVPAIFSLDTASKYRVTIGDASKELPIQRESYGDFDLRFLIGDIPARATIQIEYHLTVLPVSYGEMKVGDFEVKTPGHDRYGDILFHTSTTCGADAMKWLSTDARAYKKESGMPAIVPASFPLPEGLRDRLNDANQNGIPDSIENPSSQELQDEYRNMTQLPAELNRDILQVTRNGNTSVTIGFDSQTVARIEEIASDIFNGLACGFGGGSCLSFPINWAPLAPGNDPVLFGIPIGDGFHPLEGLPIFSAVTTKPCFSGVCPSTWPPSPWGAGGYFGDIAPFTSSVRIFVTPTLTLGMGGAVCFGKFPSLRGWIPPPGMFPFIQGGNCIVIAKPMPVCKGDGSKEDGDVTGFSGLGRTTDAWNASSCSMQMYSTAQQTQEEIQLQRDIIAYLKNPQPDKRNDLLSRLVRRGPASRKGPLLRVGSGQGATELDISLIVDRGSVGIERVVNVRNRRIAAFPDFVMDWLTRQTEELTNALFTPPNLTIIPPTDFGQNAKVDSSYKNFLAEIDQAYSRENFSSLRAQMADVRAAAPNTVSGNLQAIKAAYTFIGKLPFVKVTQKKIPLNVPWISRSELDKYERKLKEYQRTLERAQANWCLDENSQECLESKLRINAGGLQSSIMQNLRRIEEYRRFPDKLQKYVHWKQRYLYQILCNIEALEQMTFGWLYDNGIRFQKWAELYALVKAIADSWQPLLDIFADTHAQCGVCRNERYNAQYWKYKLISLILPQIPVIRFPKWPDIILDLSDVRMGMEIVVPDFVVRLSPLRLPNLPNFSLPNSPHLSITLPKLPVLPPLPNLPDLPDLPSLPTFKLPDLPPPPKIPKLAGSIKAFLKIMKLIAKMYCYYQNTFLVPEWQVGDVIAQRTERQGTLPFDFLDIQFPQISLPSIKEIRIATHLNLELKADFLAEFAEAAVRPLNRFTNDLQSIIPSRIAPDVRIPGIPNQHINLQSSLDPQNEASVLSSLMAQLEADKDTLLSVEEFALYFERTLREAGLYEQSQKLRASLDVAATEAHQIRDELEVYHKKQFDLLKQYLDEEEAALGEVQSIIDVLYEQDDLPELLTKNGDIYHAASSQQHTSSRALEKFEALTSEKQSTTRISSTDRGVRTSVRGLSHRIGRLVAQTDTESVIARANPKIPTSTPAPTGYTPRFEGIYILTEPSETQVKLFDYTELVDASTEVVVIDVDQDDDKDYLYVLGGILYVKKNHRQTPVGIPVSRDPTVDHIGSKSPLPFVPNYFEQMPSTTGEIGIRFRNALSGEHAWRMEFFDRYLEWDMVQMKMHDAAKTPKTVIDFFAQPSTASYQDGMRVTPVDRYVERGYEHPDFIVRGAQIDVHTGSISLSLSPGRSIYTGNRAVKIQYKTSGSDTEKQKVLAPNYRYEFQDTTQILAYHGPLFVIHPGTHVDRVTGSVDLAGLPLLPGMQMVSNTQSVQLGGAKKDDAGEITAESPYLVLPLGQGVNEEYQMLLSYPNGLYSARLKNMRPGYSDRAGVTLLSPQQRNDRGAPVISLEKDIRIPVYQKREYTLSDIISELSTYRVQVDVDTTQDENKNGVYDDDFVTSGSGIQIDRTTLSFGPFSQPGTRSMMLRVTDEFHNTTNMMLTFEIYAPIPQITDVYLGGGVYGNIPEGNLEGEPIHIWRIRTGSAPVLVQKDPVYTSADSQFMLTGSNETEQILFVSSGTSVAIHSNGAIPSIPEGFTTDVVPSGDQPLKLTIKNPQGVPVYEQLILAPRGVSIFDGSQHTNGTGIFLVPQARYAVVEARYNDPSLPGGLYLVDADAAPLVAIGKGGNVSLLHSGVHLEWKPDKFPHILIMRDAIPVGSLQFRTNFYYTPY